ncbi:MAG: imidazolonepropionase [Prevotellaceae bacterium]|jgi:imidazolonepropionase|nr:imidazolonepropionase [Prevotellaceae bacterium]
MLLITNIKKIVGILQEDKPRLCGEEMNTLNVIDNGYILIDDGLIKEFGQMEDCHKDIENQIDATDKMVFPAFCDSHSHIVYAGSRESEFLDKINGLTYEEIAKRGGGILNSVKLLHQTSEEELYNQALSRLKQVIGFGTGALEIKSGYGLNIEDEIKILRVIRQLKQTTDVAIKATFLGAHAVPPEYKGKQDEYVNLVCQKMIPEIAEENLADFIDVFCDKGFFTVEQTAKILQVGQKYGLRGKIHANELDFSGGVQVGVKYNALSVDHLENSGENEIAALKNSQTMPTGLPGCSFFLNLSFAPLKDMINSGLSVALATDYNPGTTPSGNMKMALSLACIKMRLTPAQAINAATINGAYAMGLSQTHGSITIGKVANLFITKNIPSIEYIPYAYTENIIDRVILKGKEFIN